MTSLNPSAGPAAHRSAVAGTLLWASLAALAVAAMNGAWAPAVRAQSGPLVPHEQAAAHGLERAWFSQIPVDASRSRVSTWYLHHDRLYGVTNSGIVAALDTETGQMLWSRQVGKPGYPAFGPGANSQYLGVVSGSKLYLLDRNDGRVMWVRGLGSAPSSGPALSEKYAFVALVTGRIEGYQLDDPATQPWYYQSKGRTFLRPTTTGSVVSWPTTEGYLYVSRANDPGILFRLETNADIVTSPAQMEPYLYIASLDGYLYCVNQNTGDELWRYSTGYAIESSPAIVDKRAYVASGEPALHALDATTGREFWAAAGVSHFAAQGKERVYASDRFGNLLVLDTKTGGVVSRMPTAEGLSTLVNDQSNRLFLVNDRGLVQCLREIGVTEPVYYRPPTGPSDKEVAAAAGAAQPTPTPPADAAAPAPDVGAEPQDAGFPDDAAAEPAAEPMDDEDPFN